jgi:hypothetical protein
MEFLLIGKGLNSNQQTLHFSNWSTRPTQGLSHTLLRLQREFSAPGTAPISVVPLYGLLTNPSRAGNKQPAELSSIEFAQDSEIYDLTASI